MKTIFQFSQEHYFIKAQGGHGFLGPLEKGKRALTQSEKGQAKQACPNF